MRVHGCVLVRSNAVEFRQKRQNQVVLAIFCEQEVQEKANLPGLGDTAYTPSKLRPLTLLDQLGQRVARHVRHFVHKIPLPFGNV